MGGRREKLLAAIRNNPKDVSFGDLCNVLNRHGFTRHDPNGSHYTFSHELLKEIITIPKKTPVLQVYVKDALRAIDEVLELMD